MGLLLWRLVLGGGNSFEEPHEHLRFATDLGKQAYEAQQPTVDITQDLRRGRPRQFEDLGDPPTFQGRDEAEGNNPAEPMQCDF